MMRLNSASASRYLSGLLATNVGVRATSNSEGFRERALSGLVTNDRMWLIGGAKRACSSAVRAGDS